MALLRSELAVADSVAPSVGRASREVSAQALRVDAPRFTPCETRRRCAAEREDFRAAAQRFRPSGFDESVRGGHSAVAFQARYAREQLPGEATKRRVETSRRRPSPQRAGRYRCESPQEDQLLERRVEDALHFGAVGLEQRLAANEKPRVRID